MPTKDKASIRKRAQIAKANKTMFIWVAVASVLVSVAVVMGVILVKKSAHQQKAINELNNTVKNLRYNNSQVATIEDQLRVLGSNQALLELKGSSADNALRVILDALPAEANPSALGASLQSKILEGIEVVSVQVYPIDAEQAGGDGPQEIRFQFSVNGSVADIKKLLMKMENSVRTFNLSSVRIEGGDGVDNLNVEGSAYYLPAQVLELQTKDVKAGGSSKPNSQAQGGKL